VDSNGPLSIPHVCPKVTETAYIFSSFKFAPSLGRLWAGNETISLRRKTSDLLEHLLTNAGRLVTRDDLLDSVWGDTNINEEGLTNCIFEARHALGDDSRHPRFIETVHGRGYRFLAPVTRIAGLDPHRETIEVLADAPFLVGRENELEILAHCWKKTLEGLRRLVLIQGEQGIGKTALADHMLAGLQSSGLALVGRGQCFASANDDEPYLALFEALGQMCRGSHGAEVREVLTRHAPGWTSRMPEIFGGETISTQQAPAKSSTLREIATALEILATTRPLLLIFEDLHLADRLTIELLAYLSQRREAAKMLVLGTCRPPYERSLPYLPEILSRVIAQASCTNLELRGLSQEAISQYLRRRLPGESAVESISRSLLARTAGNPMLVTWLVDDLASRHYRKARDLRSLAEAHESRLPEKVRFLIEHQLQTLAEADRRVLIAASVAATGGKTFSAASVCAALADPEFATLESVEARCDTLVRDGGFLRASGLTRWSDGTTAGAYSFSRSLYQEVLYASLNPGGRARMHLLIAERLEAGWRGQLSKVRADIATHFERAGEHSRAARYKHAVPRAAAMTRTLRRNAVA